MLDIKLGSSKLRWSIFPWHAKCYSLPYRFCLQRKNTCSGQVQWWNHADLLCPKILSKKVKINHYFCYIFPPSLVSPKRVLVDWQEPSCKKIFTFCWNWKNWYRTGMMHGLECWIRGFWPTAAHGNEKPQPNVYQVNSSSVSSNNLLLKKECC